MEQLNFFDYLGLDQYESDMGFILHLKEYNFTIYRSEDFNGYVVKYKACGETKIREISINFIMKNPGVIHYLQNL